MTIPASIVRSIVMGGQSANLDDVFVKRGIFADMVGQNDTTITLANTYYPISGGFTNSPIEGFSLTPDPAIQCETLESRFYEIDWHASVSCPSNSVTVKIGMRKNGTEISSSLVPGYMKNSNEAYSLSGTCVIDLEQGDKIQLVATADVSTVITFYKMVTTIRDFFIVP